MNPQTELALGQWNVDYSTFPFLAVIQCKESPLCTRAALDTLSFLYMPEGATLEECRTLKEYRTLRAVCSFVTLEFLFLFLCGLE